VLEPWAKLQAMLQAAGPVGYYYKMLTGRFATGSSFLDPRFGRFLGILILVLVPGSSFLTFLLLAFLSWALRVLEVLGALGAARLDGLGSRRPLRGLRLASCSWLGVLKSVL
jgi:hypothetical protein